MIFKGYDYFGDRGKFIDLNKETINSFVDELFGELQNIKPITRFGDFNVVDGIENIFENISKKIKDFKFRKMIPQPDLREIFLKQVGLQLENKIDKSNNKNIKDAKGLIRTFIIDEFSKYL